MKSVLLLFSVGSLYGQSQVQVSLGGVSYNHGVAGDFPVTSQVSSAPVSAAPVVNTFATASAVDTFATAPVSTPLASFQHVAPVRHLAPVRPLTPVHTVHQTV